VVRPHVNLAHEWNGKSALAGVGTGHPVSLADRVYYLIGFDAELLQDRSRGRRFTVALDFSDRIVTGGNRRLLRGETSADGTQLLGFPKVPIRSSASRPASRRDRSAD
jgi:hypothetical protein